jgi:hypothetical protein
MLTKENVQGLSVLGDDAIDFGNPFLEGIDGRAWRIVINIADKQLEKFVPEEFWDEINEGVAGILTKDYVTAAKELYELIGEILNKYVFPKLIKPVEPD